MDWVDDGPYRGERSRCGRLCRGPAGVGSQGFRSPDSDGKRWRKPASLPP